jgi:hypothetical protein
VLVHAQAANKSATSHPHQIDSHLEVSEFCSSADIHCGTGTPALQSLGDQQKGKLDEHAQVPFVSCTCSAASCACTGTGASLAGGVALKLTVQVPGHSSWE